MKKDDLITFKVDEELAEVLRTIPNRSDFIRKAVLNAHAHHSIIISPVTKSIQSERSE